MFSSVWHIFFPNFVHLIFLKYVLTDHIQFLSNGYFFLRFCCHFRYSLIADFVILHDLIYAEINYEAVKKFEFEISDKVDYIVWSCAPCSYYITVPPYLGARLGTRICLKFSFKFFISFDLYFFINWYFDNI